MKIQQLQQIEARLDKKQSRIDSLRARIEKDSAEIEKLQGQIDKGNEKIKKELRQEWETICLDAVIVGAYGMKIAHGMIAPYTHGYFIADQKYHMGGGINPQNPITNQYCKAVTGSDFQSTIKNLCKYLIDIAGWKNQDFQTLKQESDKLWNELPDSYTPDLYKKPANSWERGHIADGYETDGFDNIVRGRCGGDYSSMTTTSQNDLAAFLPVLKGFCPDHYSPGNEKLTLVKEVYERHGIDADLSDLNEWAKRNPTRCMSDNPYFISKQEAQRDSDLEEDIPF